MGTFTEEVANAVRAGLCATLAASDGATELVNKVYGVSGDTLNVARALRRQLCSDDPDNDPTYTPPFTGGQCNVNGGGYTVVIQLNRAGGGTSSFTRRCRGPIAGVRCRQVSETQGVPEINARNSTPNTNCGVNLPDLGQQWFSLSTQSDIAAPQNGATIQILSITPCPGIPNDCGDPPPPPPTATAEIAVTPAGATHV